MKFIANVLWFLFTGLFSALLWTLIGIVWCITIIGIPFGKQAFKMARLVIWPFGKTVHGHFFRHPIANIIWFVFGGFGLAIAYLVGGLFWSITIIGIPFGRQCFKLASLAVAPFGATIN